MENQGQRELKWIRRVYGALAIYEAFQRNVWHTNLKARFMCKSDNKFWVSLYPLRYKILVQDTYLLDLWPEDAQNSKVGIMWISDQDTHCDDLLWLESLIDGWGQTLTLNRWIISRHCTHTSGQICITNFFQEELRLRPFPDRLSSQISSVLLTLRLVLWDWIQSL